MENIIYTKLDKSHLKQIHDYKVRNRLFLEPWEPLRDESFYSLESTSKTLDIILKDMEDRKSYSMVIIDEDKVIGRVNATNIVMGPFQSCYLGYSMDKDYQGRGIMTKGVKEISHILFTDYKLHRIEANIMPRNISSIKMIEKAGFSYEGLSPRYVKIYGKWEDHKHFVLLNSTIE